MEGTSGPRTSEHPPHPASRPAGLHPPPGEQLRAPMPHPLISSDGSASPATQGPSRPPASARAFTWRAFLIGVLLIPVNAYWLVQMERIRYSAHPTTVSLFFNAVFILLALTVLNALVGRQWPRAAMNR